MLRQLLLAVALVASLAGLACSQPVAPAVFNIAIVGTTESINNASSIIALALNDYSTSLGGVGIQLSTVLVPLPAVPTYPLDYLDRISQSFRSMSSNVIGIINLMDSAVVQSALENTSIPRVDVFSAQKEQALYDVYMRIGVKFYVDALASLCQRFGWRRLSVVVSDEAEESFVLLRSEIQRRSTDPASNFAVAMIREFSSDATILANHDESYALNVSLIVVISKGNSLARLIDVTVRSRDDRAQYLWICPLVGADIEVNEFSREIALRQPEYYGVLGILDSSTNVLVSSIVRRMTTSLGRAPTSSQRLTYDAMLVYADSAVRTVQAGQMPSNRTAFITAINQADFLGSTGFFEFGAISRDGDLAVLNFALLHGASSVTVETRDYAGWSRREGLHQEQDQQYSELVFFDGSSDVPSDGFAQIVEFGIAAPVSRFPEFKQWEGALRVAKANARRDGLLTRFGLHIHVADTGLDEAAALEQTLHIISEENILVCIGEVIPRVTESLHYVLKSNKIVQASPVATSVTLSNRDQFPYYTRTVPSDTTLFSALSHALRSKFGWTNIAVLFSADLESATSAATLSSICASRGITVVASRGMQDLQTATIEAALTQIRDSGARLIFVALSPDAVKPVFEAARRLQMTESGSGFVWVFNFGVHLLDTIDPQLSSFIPEASISAAPAPGAGAEYQRFLNSTRYWAADLNLDPLLSTSYVYDTAFTVIQAVRSLDSRGLDYYNRTAFYAELQRVDFVGATGRVAFLNGDRLYASVSLVRRTRGDWSQFALAAFGASTTEVSAFIETSAFVFADGTATVPKDLILNYMKWQDGAGLAMVLITALLLLCIICSAVLIFAWRNNIMIRASSPAFLQVLLVGVTLAVLSVLPSTGELNDASCTIRTWLFVFGFVMSYGACLLKNFRVYRLWSEASMRIIRISNLHLIGYSSVFMIPFTLLLIIWTAIDRPVAVVRGSNLICEPGRSIVWSLLEFLGIGIMLAAGVVLAFMTRAIPQLYNECRYIALATYNMTFCLVIGVALSFVLQPVSVTAAYICYAVGVLFAFGGMWGIVIGPKIYLIIFHPDKLADLSSGHSSSRSAQATLSTGSRTGTSMTPASSRKSSPKYQGRGSSSRSSKSSTKSGSKGSSSK